MGAENFANFATTLLNGAIASTSATSFSVTGGQGSLFPAGNFLVSIDSEILQIVSRSGDTFTVGSGGRGYNGTTAATHSNGVTVLLPICAYNLQHLWQNVADTYIPAVPPQQTGGTASATDNEFEATGAWTLYPTPGAGTIFNAGATLKSHLLLSRNTADSTVYYAYMPFSPGSNPWTATCKLSEGTFLLANNSDQAQTDFFVSDLSIPTNGTDTGNRIKLNTVCANTATGVPALGGNVLNTTSHIVRTLKTVSGVSSFLGSFVSVPLTGPMWLRITCNGAGAYQTMVSTDGVTYTLLFSAGTFSFTVASLGFSFHAFNPSGQWVAHNAAIDYLRVVNGAVLSGYGG